MKQEDKQLLLKDLCARLPYGVIIQEYNEEYGYADNALNTIGIGYFSIHEACIEGTWINHIENVKPYLRPMSSMTEEEEKEFDSLWNEGFGKAFDAQLNGQNDLEVKTLEITASYKSIQWLLKNHFDFMGLIPRGLGLEAPEGMYKR